MISSSLKCLTVSAALFAAAVTGALAADLYLTPKGAGLKNGTDFENAYDGSKGGLQKCWDGLKPGDTCHVGPGHFKDATLRIRSGGALNRYKKLLGHKTEDGPPVFTGNWDKMSPAAGPDFITLFPGADYVSIEGLSVRHYRHAVTNLRAGRNSGLRLRDLDISDARIAVEIYGDAQCSWGPPGGPGCKEPKKASHDIRLRNVNIKNCTKGGVRFRFGVHKARLTDCRVDMGGKPYAVEPGADMVGFSLGDGKSAREDSPDRDITYIGCTARNAYDDNGEEYWQGDGFKSENYSTGVSYIRCGAFDNTDGGFDVKGPGTRLVDCVAARNKRNYRLWNVDETPAGRAVLINCLGHHAKFWGDRHSIANLHLFGDAVVKRSTFHNVLNTDPSVGSYVILQEDLFNQTGFVTELVDSLYSYDGSSTLGTVLLHVKDTKKSSSSVSEAGTVSWDGVENTGTDPQYVDPREGFEGGGDDFNSRAYGRSKGYYERSGKAAPSKRKQAPGS